MNVLIPTDGEAWKAVEGWPYEVSNKGRVGRTEGYNGVTAAGYILKPNTDRYGYPRVQLQDSPRTRYVTVHRLVAETWMPCDWEGFQVNHRDCDKANNDLDNLEWVTPAENQQHASRHGLMTPTVGEVNGMAKMTVDRVREIRERYAGGGVSQYELAREYGVTQSNISMIVNRVTWSEAA